VTTLSAQRVAFRLAAVAGLAVAAVLMILIPVAFAVVAGLLVGAFMHRLVLGGAKATVIKVLGAEPLGEGAETRLESLVETICGSHGIPEPELLIVGESALDAALVTRGSDLALIVTRGLLDHLDRLELEAVVARQLTADLAKAEAATVYAAMATRFGRFAGGVNIANGARVRADFAGVALTRYPPALASALAKAAESDRMASQPATEHLWMVGSVDLDGFSLGARVDALREL